MDSVNILYVTDDKGVMILGVSLTSLYTNNIDIDELRVFIVDDNISSINKRRLEECAEIFNRSITFIDKPNISKLIGAKPKTGKWPDNIFCRLFTPYLFSDHIEVEKVIYLDTDTIINNSILPIWKQDLKEYPCGAVLECMSDLHKKAIGLDHSTPYFNSGVLLIDIDQWKKKEIESKVQIYAKNNMNRLEYPDEGILNAVLNGKVRILAPQYNLTTLKCAFTYRELRTYRKSRVMYKEEEYAYANNYPTIIHYTNSFIVDRPWVNNSRIRHPFFYIWNSYKEKSLWREEPLTRLEKGVRKTTEHLIQLLPRPIVISIMSVIYCYIKPIRYLIKGLQ